MGKLLACPFCRELFAAGEVSRCPHCDLPIVDLQKLPPSAEAEALEELSVLDSPFDRTLPLGYLGRGRGALLLVTLLGLSAFFIPWVSLTRPDPIQLSGFDLARGGASWLFGGAIGWALLVALLLSRRTVNQLRGARVIAVTFPLMTVVEAAMMLLRPPAESRFFSSGLAYEAGLYASLAIGLVGALLGARLGGNPKELSDLARPLGDTPRRPGETVH